MTQAQVAELLGFSLLLAVGQSLFKMAALSIAGEPGAAGFVGLLQVPVFWCAIVLYGAATLLWVHVLQTVPLSRAYPFAALGFLIVPALSAYFFREKITLVYGLGAMLIVGGIILTARA